MLGPAKYIGVVGSGEGIGVRGPGTINETSLLGFSEQYGSNKRQVQGEKMSQYIELGVGSDLLNWGSRVKEWEVPNSKNEPTLRRRPI